MRRLAILLTIVCAAAPALAGLSVGDTIRFYDREGNTGGEYGVAMANLNPSPEMFRTFCVQKGEFLDFNRAGFKIEGITNYSEFVGGNPLTAYSAYLYTQFSKGTLSNYDYTTNSAEHTRDANALQRALWFLEGETSLGTNLRTIAWVKEAINAVGVKIAGYNYNPTGQAAWGTGVGNVRVLNLTWATSRFAKAGTPAQDVLYMLPDPVPAVDAPGAALLGLIGLGLAAWVKRRLS